MGSGVIDDETVQRIKGHLNAASMALSSARNCWLNAGLPTFAGELDAATGIVRKQRACITNGSYAECPAWDQRST